MPKILFSRISDNVPVGEFVMEGNTLTATGMAESVLEVARKRGEKDADVFSRYRSWSNGVFVSRDAVTTPRLKTTTLTEGPRKDRYRD